MAREQPLTTYGERDRYLNAAHGAVSLVPFLSLMLGIASLDESAMAHRLHCRKIRAGSPRAALPLRSHSDDPSQFITVASLAEGQTPSYVRIRIPVFLVVIQKVKGLTPR